MKSNFIFRRIPSFVLTSFVKKFVCIWWNFGWYRINKRYVLLLWYEELYFSLFLYFLFRNIEKLNKILLRNVLRRKKLIYLSQNNLSYWFIFKLFDSSAKEEPIKLLNIKIACRVCIKLLENCNRVFL